MERGKAVAIVECNGLPTAIAFLDTALKSANVKLLGMELAKGEGMVDIKIMGNIGAVKAATNAGIITANGIGGILGEITIPRPDDNIDCMLKNTFVMHSLKQNESHSSNQKKDSNSSEINENENLLVEDQNFSKESKVNYTCNLCKDPQCPRVKGRSHVECIHYNEDREQ